MMMLSRPRDTTVASVAWSDMSLAKASEVLLWQDKIKAKIMGFLSHSGKNDAQMVSSHKQSDHITLDLVFSVSQRLLHHCNTNNQLQSPRTICHMSYFLLPYRQTLTLKGRVPVTNHAHTHYNRLTEQRWMCFNAEWNRSVYAKAVYDLTPIIGKQVNLSCIIVLRTCT